MFLKNRLERFISKVNSYDSWGGGGNSADDSGRVSGSFGASGSGTGGDFGSFGSNLSKALAKIDDPIAQAILGLTNPLSKGILSVGALASAAGKTWGSSGPGYTDPTQSGDTMPQDGITLSQAIEKINSSTDLNATQKNRAVESIRQSGLPLDTAVPSGGNVSGSNSNKYSYNGTRGIWDNYVNEFYDTAKEEYTKQGTDIKSAVDDTLAKNQSTIGTVTDDKNKYNSILDTAAAGTSNNLSDAAWAFKNDVEPLVNTANAGLSSNVNEFGGRIDTSLNDLKTALGDSYGNFETGSTNVLDSLKAAIGNIGDQYTTGTRNAADTAIEGTKTGLSNYLKDRAASSAILGNEIDTNRDNLTGSTNKTAGSYIDTATGANDKYQGTMDKLLPDYKEATEPTTTKQSELYKSLMDSIQGNNSLSPVGFSVNGQEHSWIPNKNLSAALKTADLGQADYNNTIGYAKDLRDTGAKYAGDQYTTANKTASGIYDVDQGRNKTNYDAASNATTVKNSDRVTGIDDAFRNRGISDAAVSNYDQSAIDKILNITRKDATDLYNEDKSLISKLQELAQANTKDINVAETSGAKDIYTANFDALKNQFLNSYGAKKDSAELSRNILNDIFKNTNTAATDSFNRSLDTGKLASDISNKELINRLAALQQGSGNLNYLDALSKLAAGENANVATDKGIAVDQSRVDAYNDANEPSLLDYLTSGASLYNSIFG